MPAESLLVLHLNRDHIAIPSHNYDMCIVMLLIRDLAYLWEPNIIIAIPTHVGSCSFDMLVSYCRRLQHFQYEMCCWIKHPVLVDTWLIKQTQVSFWEFVVPKGKWFRMVACSNTWTHCTCWGCCCVWTPLLYQQALGKHSYQWCRQTCVPINVLLAHSMLFVVV